MRDLGRRAFSGLIWAGAADAAGKAAGLRRHARARAAARAERVRPGRVRALGHLRLDYVGDLGLGAALIYRSDAEDPRVSSTAFWIGIVGSLVAVRGLLVRRSAAGGASAPATRSSPLFRVLALQFPFAALGKAHEYRLRRALRVPHPVRPQARRRADQGRASASRSRWPAPAPWSLVIGQVAGLAGAVDRAVAGPPLPPSLRDLARPRAARRCCASASGIVAVGVLGQGAKNFDYMVVGGEARAPPPSASTTSPSGCPSW